MARYPRPTAFCKAGVEASFAVDDVTRPESLSGSYDLILDMGCYHSLNPDGKHNYQDMIKERLSPGGTFLLYGFTNHPEGASITENDQESFNNFLSEISNTIGGDISQRQSVWLEYRKPRFDNGDA